MTQGIQNFTTLGADDCVSDWVPMPGRSLSVEVLVYPDWEVTPGRSIAIDVACEVFESCINYRFEYPGDALKLEFICCALPCSNDWQDFAGDSLILDATEDRSCDQSWSPVAGNAVDFDFTCCGNLWVDTPGNAVNFDFLCPGGEVILDVPACDSSCPGTWYPQPGDNLDIEFVCCGTAGGSEIILTDVQAYEGQTFNFDYTSDKLFAPAATEGQTLAATLTAPQNITFDPEFEHGEEVDASLWTEMAIPADFYVGEEFKPLALNTYPTIMMSANGYEGQTASVGIFTSSILAVSYHAGETLVADLDDRPAELLSIGIQTGETAEISIVIHRLVAASFSTGEYAVGDLETEPYEGIQATFEIGETLDATADTITGFVITPHHGETLDADLNTSVAIPMVMHVGEEVSLEMYEAEYWNPEPTAYVGEDASLSLSVGTFSFGVMIGESGEDFEADLTTNEKAALVANGSTGETFDLSISWAANVGDIKFYHGTSAVVDTLEFDQLIRAFDGATADVAFATEMTIPVAAHEGGRLDVDLKTGPSEPIGIFTASHGEELTVQTLALLKAVFLGVTFYNSYVFNVGMPWLGTFMDLDTGCCSNHHPDQQDYHIIEMNDAEFGDQRFDGDRIRATVDFQTQPRFRFDFMHGETMLAVEDNTFLIYPRVTTGETMSVSLESDNINFPLCPVNFIPDGDNIYAELDYVDTATCYADYAYAGENMSVRLQSDQNFQEQYTTGETMVCDLTLRGAWVLRAGHGEHVRVSNPEMTLEGMNGESMTVSFYVDPIIGGHGETLEASLTTLYEVVFLEDGCLDNEYIWQDENGDPIPEKFNPIPVELDPYQHDIKARCQ